MVQAHNVVEFIKCFIVVFIVVQAHNVVKFIKCFVVGCNCFYSAQSINYWSIFCLKGCVSFDILSEISTFREQWDENWNSLLKIKFPCSCIECFVQYIGYGNSWQGTMHSLFCCEMNVIFRGLIENGFLLFKMNLKQWMTVD